MGLFLRGVHDGKTLKHVSPDILGDAYEWILKYFVPSKAKEREVYTGREMIKLIIEMPDPNKRTRGYHHPQ